MKILLIGKTGQIGREIEKYASDKHEIKAFSRKQLDVENYEKIEKIIDSFKPDCFINASGFHVISECERNPDQAFRINTYAVRKLAEMCTDRNIRLVNFSSDKVFDGRKRTPYVEKDVTNPIQIYGMSKLAGERAIHSYSNRAITIRTCGVYGGYSGSRIKKGNFVLMIIEQSKMKKFLEISSEQIACFINAEDLARTTVELLEKNVEGGIYHVVNEGFGSWAQFAQKIVKLADIQMKIVPIDRSGVFSSIKIPIFAALGIKKIQSKGINMPSWEEGLSRYIKFLRSEKII